MAGVTVRDALASPTVFRAFNVLIGAARLREIFVSEYVRPTHGQRVLDIGCGTGEMVPFLPGVEYVGFDESAEYIREARTQFPGTTFSHERIDAHVATPESFDMVLAHGVLHHLTDDEALELLRLAHVSLRPGGRLITLDGCHVDGQSTVTRWLLSHDRGRYVRSREEYLRLIHAVFPGARAVVREDLLRIPYTHVIAECVRTG